VRQDCESDSRGLGQSIRLCAFPTKLAIYKVIRIKYTSQGCCKEISLKQIVDTRSKEIVNSSTDMFVYCDRIMMVAQRISIISRCLEPPYNRQQNDKFSAQLLQGVIKV